MKKQHLRIQIIEKSKQWYATTINGEKLTAQQTADAIKSGASYEFVSPTEWR